MLTDVECDRDTGLSAIKRLIEEGIINPKAKEATKASIAKLQGLTVVRTDQVRERINSEYFNPLKLLENYVCNINAECGLGNTDTTSTKYSGPGRVPL